VVFLGDLFGGIKAILISLSLRDLAIQILPNGHACCRQPGVIILGEALLGI
jgi:hypothetical protein